MRLWNSHLRLPSLNTWVSTGGVVTGGGWTCHEGCLAGGRGPWRGGVASSLDKCLTLLLPPDPCRCKQIPTVPATTIDLSLGFLCCRGLTSPQSMSQNKSFFFKYWIIMTRKVDKKQNGEEWSGVVAVPLRSLAMWVSGVVEWVCEKNAEDLGVAGRRKKKTINRAQQSILEPAQEAGMLMQVQWEPGQDASEEHQDFISH